MNTGNIVANVVNDVCVNMNELDLLFDENDLAVINLPNGKQTIINKKGRVAFNLRVKEVDKITHFEGIYYFVTISKNIINNLCPICSSKKEKLTIIMEYCDAYRNVAARSLDGWVTIETHDDYLWCGYHTESIVSLNRLSGKQYEEISNVCIQNVFLLDKGRYIQNLIDLDFIRPVCDGKYFLARSLKMGRWFLMTKDRKCVYMSNKHDIYNCLVSKDMKSFIVEIDFKWYLVTEDKWLDDATEMDKSGYVSPFELFK